ncbi:class I SAM-dependent methyltransferase [Pseudalkalibacillus berkeleyi]|uniref:Class I SAM-dependent methyltransferase n=1 Tax=Pseudalkalibacillus berkeleyi TaxID=1069813 RepID=A0ABS9H2D7_9BACL|nr:class I SAM-dependent methyltransferase [Pseudalkalibacillus berkeleyi]MCF6137815.1 class I SAM-dependent methyltransferase [Pseudalkalibacillus berkeleyi]
MNQISVSKINGEAWNQSAYQAWVKRHGNPSEYAKVLIADRERSVAHYLKYMGEVKGKRIANLLGSKGNKAVSFALLDADVTVVDISHENRKYAMELAQAADVCIDYIVSDVLNIPKEKRLLDFDYVILELGVLHYFVDLKPLFKVIYESLRPGGKLILRDFHPIVSKLLSVSDRQMIANGDYFDTSLVEVNVAYGELLEKNEQHSLKKNKIRRWTLGEVVTSMVEAELTIRSLEEEANIRWAFPKDSPEKIEERLPGLFTVLATKD